jgi:beta-lactamase class A
VDLDALLAAPELTATTWSVAASRLDSEGTHPLLGHSPVTLLRTASVAKVFLLVEVAVALDEGRLAAAAMLTRRSMPPVADSGLWQHLLTDELPLCDVARLVGYCSDNWATNVLLHHVGLAPVQARAAALAPHGSQLWDQVRDVRTAADPTTLSVGCARDWADLFAGLSTGRVGGPRASATVLEWLAAGVDVSMVAAALGLDPLSHAQTDRGISVWNKTGTDDGVRADIGLMELSGRSVSYAVICNWEPEVGDPRDAVLATMRSIGAHLRSAVR